MSKLIFDFFCALLGLIFLSPLLLFIIFWIKFDSNGPVFFLQKRVGLNGKIFSIIKFRTMVTDAESKGLKITVGNDPRITNCGKFLRKYKLDELAQLFNVLNGTMSFVGPRPEVPDYIALYPKDMRDTILSVKPGVTDYASIKFRAESDMLSNADDPNKTYIEKILPIKQNYCLKYVNERNIILDIKIIFLTIICIFK